MEREPEQKVVSSGVIFTAGVVWIGMNRYLVRRDCVFSPNNFQGSLY